MKYTFSVFHECFFKCKSFLFIESLILKQKKIDSFYSNIVFGRYFDSFCVNLR